MVKESERKREYRPRAPHQPGCGCAVCRIKDAAPEILPPTQAEIEDGIRPVRLDSLSPTSQFNLDGQKYLAKEGVEGMVVCCNLSTNDTATLGGSTMVKPIK